MIYWTCCTHPVSKHYPQNQDEGYKCLQCPPARVCFPADLPEPAQDLTRYAEHVKLGAGWKEPLR